MKYSITVKRRGENITRKIEGKTIEDALTNFLEQCMEEDDTGIFFELENANIEHFKNNKNFYVINDYGIVLESLKINQ